MSNNILSVTEAADLKLGIPQGRVRLHRMKTLVRSYLLYSVDLLLVLCGFFVYLGVTAGSLEGSLQLLSEHPFWIPLLLFFWFFYAYLFELYGLHGAPKRIVFRNTFIVATLVGFTYLFVPFITPTFPVSRYPAFLFIAVLVGLLCTWRVLFATVFKIPVFVKRALIVGAGWTGIELLKTLQADKVLEHQSGYHFFGLLDDNKDKIGREYDGTRVINHTKELLKYATRLKIDEIVLALPASHHISAHLYEQLMACKEKGIIVNSAQSVYESATGKVMVKQKGNDYYLNYPYELKHTRRAYLLINRILNVICGALGMVVLGFTIPFVWLMNLLFNRGSLLYIQERSGRHGKPFNIYKFRSMVEDAEKESGPVWSHANDTRITPFGRFMRKTRIDELPQFVNLLKGDMNLIGPRPERPIFVGELVKRIPFYNVRHEVKPGISGWAQINYKYGSDEEDALKKLQYDLHYIRHRNLLLDLKILLSTLNVVIKFKGT